LPPEGTLNEAGNGGEAPIPLEGKTEKHREYTYSELFSENAWVRRSHTFSQRRQYSLKSGGRGSG